VKLGGTPADDNYETIKLTISDPPATYYLNVGTSGHPEGCVFKDYRLTVNAKGNATLTLEVDSIDSLVPSNLVIGEDSVEKPDEFDNFQGVFAQIDHDEEYVATTMTEVIGGGVMGFRFGGFSEQLYRGDAEK
jgi:hypothetical protein